MGWTGRYAMSAALPLRENFNADALRPPARTSRKAGQSRRLLALASIYASCSRTDVVRIGAVCRR